MDSELNVEEKAILKTNKEMLKKRIVYMAFTTGFNLIILYWCFILYSTISFDKIIILMFTNVFFAFYYYDKSKKIKKDLFQTYYNEFLKEEK